MDRPALPPGRHSRPLTTCRRAASPALGSRRYRSASEFAPTIDDVLRVEAGKLIRFDQVDVRCRYCARWRERPLDAPPRCLRTARSRHGRSLRRPRRPCADRGCARGRRTGPPTIPNCVACRGRSAVCRGTRHLQLAVRSCTSQALLDRTLDPRHATNASEVHAARPRCAELSYAVVQIYLDPGRRYPLGRPVRVEKPCCAVSDVVTVAARFAATSTTLSPLPKALLQHVARRCHPLGGCGGASPLAGRSRLSFLRASGHSTGCAACLTRMDTCVLTELTRRSAGRRPPGQPTTR